MFRLYFISRMDPGQAPSVFDYLSSRDYLRDMLEWSKQGARGLTHRAILEKLGISSSGFLANVLSGKNNLNPAQAKSLGEILALPPAEARFFQTLVLFTQAKGIEEKGDALDGMRNQMRARNKQLDPRQYSLFSKWIYPLVFELAALMPITDNFKEVSDLLDGSVKPEDVRKALEVLESLALLEKDADGRYRQAHVTVRTGDEITSVDVVKYQQSILRKAMEALEKVDASLRTISATTLPLSPAGLERVKEEARLFRDKLLKLSEQDRGADRVYLLSLNVFPGTKPLSGDKP